MSIIRSHDAFYASEGKVPVKDSFKFIASLIQGYNQESLSIADIGCAVGAFPEYLRNIFPSSNVVGYEYLESLVDAGRAMFPGLMLKQASILNRGGVSEKYDVVTCLGVLSIFDNIELPVSNLCCWVKPGGKLIIHGMYNPDDVDVFVKYQSSADYGGPEYESGWNIVSQKTLSRILGECGAENVIYHPFHMSMDLFRKDGDPLRSWTERMDDGRRQIINGLCIKQPQYIVEVDM